MEMHQVRYFLAVCDTLNFTRAAELCHVSQPSLTLAIKKLEDALGGVLFHRSRKGVFLTDFGQRMLPYLQQVQAGSDSALAVARQYDKVERIPLRVGVLNTLGPLPAVQFLAAFKESHPDIEVDLVPFPHVRLASDLAAGSCELVIGNPDALGEAVGDFQVLYSEPYVVIFPPGHPFARHKAVPLTAVSGEPYVDRLACEYRDQVLALTGQRQIRLYATHRSESELWVQAMVLAGMGFAFMPERSVCLPGLDWRPLVEPALARQVVVAAGRGRPLEGAAAGFMAAAAKFPW